MWCSVVVVGYLSVYPFVCLSVYLSVLLSISICLSASVKKKLFCETSSLFTFRSWHHQKMQQFWETSSIFELDNIKNAAMLRDLLNFWTWQHQKTQQFCETSFQNGKLSAELTASYQWFTNVFCICSFICLKYCAYHEKVRPGHTKCSTCHAKSS